MARPQTTVLEALAQRLAIRSRRAVPRLRPARRRRHSVHGARRWTGSRRGSAHALRGDGRRSTATASRRCSTTAPSRSSRFFAALKLGAIQVPINTAYKGEFLRHQLADSGAKVFVVQGDYASRARRDRRRREHADAHALHHRRSARRDHRRRARDPVGRRASARGGDEPIDVSHVRPSDLACFIYTAGTTGPSKGCMLPHNYIVSLADQIARAWQRRADDVVLTPLPLFHFNAISVCVVGTLLVGGQRGDRTALLGEQLLARGQAHRRDDGLDARVARDPRSRTPTTIPTRPGTSCGSARRRRCRPTPTASGRSASGARRSAAGYGLTEASLVSHARRGRAEQARARRASRTATSSRCASSTTTTSRSPVGEVGEIVCRPDRPEPDVRRLLEPARRDRRRDSQPLVPHRRPRPARRRRLHLLRRPQEGRAAPPGREHLELRDGEDVVRPRRRSARRRGARGAERARRGRREGHRRAAGRCRRSPKKSCAGGWPSGCRSSRSRATSSSATTCPATRSAGSSSTSSATRA